MWSYVVYTQHIYYIHETSTINTQSINSYNVWNKQQLTNACQHGGMLCDICTYYIQCKAIHKTL